MNKHYKYGKKWIEGSYRSFINNLFITTKSRMKSSDNMSLEYLINLYETQNGKCALSGIKMANLIGDHATISIDRIDPNFGYIIGNVQLVCQFINLGKNKHTNSEVVEFLNMIKENNESIK